MPRIASHLDPASDEFLRNRERMAELVADLEAALEAEGYAVEPPLVAALRRRLAGE